MRSLINTVKCLVVVYIIITVGKYLVNEFLPDPMDITGHITMDKYTLEQSLGVAFTSDPGKSGQIYEFTDSTISVESDKENGISMVYCNGTPCGIHIDDNQYSMYGVKLGDPIISVPRLTTFSNNGYYEIIDDLYDMSPSNATYFYNTNTNEGLVVVSNEKTNRVVSMTYYNNFSKITENSRHEIY